MGFIVNRPIKDNPTNYLDILNPQHMLHHWLLCEYIYYFMTLAYHHGYYFIKGRSGKY